MSDVALKCESRFKKKKDSNCDWKIQIMAEQSHNDYAIFIWYKILFELDHYILFKYF